MSTLASVLASEALHEHVRPVPVAEVQNPQKRARFGPQPVRAEAFSEMQSPHPYGVLPGGNRFLDDNTAASQSSPLDLMSDEAWYHILEFCDGNDLGRMLKTCRYFYVAASEPELWRDLVLRRQDSSTIGETGASWKDTYVKLFARHTGDHLPIAVAGVYSDFYYRLHSCRSFAIPEAWLESSSDTVDRVQVSNMSIERFTSDYEQPNRPVVIAGAACSWKAFRDWPECPEYFLKHAKGRSFRATSGAAPLPGNFTLEAYHNYCQSAQLEEAPLYLFDRTALNPGSILWNDYFPDMQKSCPYWDPERSDTTHDLFKILGEGRRPDHTWLIMGPKRSGSVFHIDPNATHAWNAAICGRKRWIFYPPGVTPPGVHPSEDGDEVALPLSIGEWLFTFWEEHLERIQSAPPYKRPLECTALPGDVIFVPHGWWHLVVNLDEINIAITHNYVSSSNLTSVLKFLDEKRDQVSGCRDRDDSIKPERLHGEFVLCLKEKYPYLAEEALDNPTWACKAWKDAAMHEESDIAIPHKSPTSCTATSVMSRAKSEAEEASGGFSFSFM